MGNQCVTLFNSTAMEGAMQTLDYEGYKRNKVGKSNETSLLNSFLALGLVYCLYSSVK